MKLSVPIQEYLKRKEYSKISYPYTGRGYLRACGWYKSLLKKVPVNSKGDPLPWYSYSAIHFIEKRVGPSFKVFEYGSGYSTLWWARKCSTVMACEHDVKWYSHIKEMVPNNVQILHVNLDSDGEYAKTALKQSSNFDIIVIDGMDRVNTATRCLEALSSSGVLIWDDSDRPNTGMDKESIEMLSNKGFKKIDFIGLGPVSGERQCTSILYRSENCFGI